MIYAVIFQCLVAPIAINIFRDLLGEQNFTLKRFCLNAVISLTCFLLESIIVCSCSSFFVHWCGLNTRILNPFIILFYRNNLDFDFGFMLSLFSVLYYQFSTFLFFFVFTTKNKKYIIKTCFFYSIWLLVTIILSISFPDVRG